MAAIDHRDAGEVRGAKSLLQGEGMRRRQRCDIAFDPERNEVLVGADDVFGNDPRIRRFLDADQTERNIGIFGQRLSKAMVRG
jgi:hypothetical protein